jgi:hypothetical protein
MNISQSLMNNVFSVNCPQAIKLRYIDKVATEQSEAMKRGLYFEWLLLGQSSQEAPQLEKLKNGGKSQAEKDIDELAGIAKKTLELLGINMESIQPQMRLEVDGMSGIIDMIANDIENPDRLAIYDIKYTETKYDDRWNGWADLENKLDSKRQARHYIHLYHLKHGVYLPYYFLVFGKSGWCRVIKCVMTSESLNLHVQEVNAVRDMLGTWEKAKWPAVPSYDKCRDCYVAQYCKSVKLTPDVEQYEV